MKYYNYFSPLDWIVFVAIIAVSFAILFSQKIVKQNNNSSVEYLLMGRRLTLPMFVATLVATWYACIIGVAQIAFEKGIYNFITQGVFWYISAVIFSLFFVSRARKSQALSFPEMITKFYGPKSGIITAIMLYVKVLPIPYAMALGIFLNGFFGININLAMAIGMGLIAIHCIYVGLKSIIVFDIIQFVFMFVAIIMVVVYSYDTFGGSEYLISKLPDYHLKVTAQETWSTLFVWFFIALNATLLSPLFYQRCLATQTEKSAKMGIYISVVLWMICDVFTTIGAMYAKANMPDAAPEDAYLVYALTIFPEGMRGIFMAAILITVLSAADSFLFLSSTIISYDLMPEKLRTSNVIRKLSIIISAVLTVILSMYFNGKIEQAWMTFETIFMAGLFLPIVVGILYPKILTDKQCAIVILSSSLFATAWKLVGGEEIINCMYVGCAFNFIVLLKFITLNKALKSKTVTPVHSS